MITKIQWGIGNPGKLWTGDIPEAGAIVDAKIIERKCECGASTRKLRATPIEIGAEGIAALEIPTLFLTAGGVGSIYIDRELDCRLTVWNWSHREGGHVVVNPLAVVGGRLPEGDSSYQPAPAKAGFRWVCTYGGSTLSEYLLVVDSDGIEEQPERFILPLVSLAGTCPPCREKQARDAGYPLCTPSVALLASFVAQNAPDCSSRKKRFLAFAVAGDEAGMLEMLPEIREWVLENVGRTNSEYRLLDADSKPVLLPDEWQVIIAGENA